MARYSYYREKKGDEPMFCSIKTAKKLLKKSLKKDPNSEACAWTEHYDRDGGLFEVTSIELTGNNSHFKYNQHL